MLQLLMKMDAIMNLLECLCVVFDFFVVERRNGKETAIEVCSCWRRIVAFETDEGGGAGGRLYC
ncbi:hypothetical protein ACB092_12G101000 [Castanea dentata]